MKDIIIGGEILATSITAGSALGGAIGGPIGATLGGGIGAMVGGAIAVTAVIVRRFRKKKTKFLKKSPKRTLLS